MTTRSQHEPPRVCTKCEKLKLSEDFPPLHWHVAGGICIACFRIRNRQNLKARIKARGSAWREFPAERS